MPAAAIAVKWRPQIARVNSTAGRHGTGPRRLRCSAVAKLLSSTPIRTEAVT